MGRPPGAVAIPIVPTTPTLVLTYTATPSPVEVLLVLTPPFFDTGTQEASPDADIAAGAWTTHTGGTTNLYQTIDELVADTADYIQSEPDPDNSIYRGRLSDVDSPVAGSRTIKWTIRKTPGDGARVDAALRVYEGATLRQTFTRLDVTGDWTEFTETLTASIVDYDNLEFEVEADQI